MALVSAHVSNMGPHMALVHFHYVSVPTLLLLFIHSLFIFYSHYPNDRVIPNGQEGIVASMI